MYMHSGAAILAACLYSGCARQLLAIHTRICPLSPFKPTHVFFAKEWTRDMRMAVLAALV